MTQFPSFSQDDTLSVFSLIFLFQVQNADDVLITPLEKFRKEQIGAAKVRDPLRAQLATKQRQRFHAAWHPRPFPSPPFVSPAVCKSLIKTKA